MSLALAALVCCRQPQVDPSDGDPSERDPLDLRPAAPADTGEGPDPSFRDGLTEQGVVTCADPKARDREGPMVEADWGPDWAAQLPDGVAQEDHAPGAGLAVADFTGDGRTDVFLANLTACQLFVWDGDTLVDVGATNLPTGTETCRSRGAVAVDIDGDDDFDILTVRPGRPNFVWSNDGTGHFTDVTAEAGLEASAEDHWGVSVGDVDGDLDLDLFFVAYSYIPDEKDPGTGGPNSLFVNQGDGTFVRSKSLPPEAVNGHTWAGIVADLDIDGDQDLYVVNDFARGNEWVSNDGHGSFTATSGNGLDVGSDYMGVGIGDLNDDRYPDLLLSDWNFIALLVSDGAGTAWYDVASARGLRLTQKDGRFVGWGPELQDMDADGRLDVVISYGTLVDYGLMVTEVNPAEQPDGLWLQETDGSFAQAAEAWGVADVGVGRGYVLTDLDGDGYLDWIKRSYRSGRSPAYVSRCGANSWLEVDLRDAPPNTKGIGARVEVRAGGLRYTRWIVAGGTSFASGGPPVAHFGLGSAPMIDQLRVFWPGGATSTYADVPARQRVTVAAPSLL